MLAMEHTKVRPSFEGCYSYDKLKSEGLVDEETLDDEIIRVHITENNDGCWQQVWSVLESFCSHELSNEAYD